jgi:hypothetical protein
MYEMIPHLCTKYGDQALKDRSSILRFDEKSRWGKSGSNHDVMMIPYSGRYPASNSRRDFRLFFAFSGYSIGMPLLPSQKVQYGCPCISLNDQTSFFEVCKNWLCARVCVLGGTAVRISSQFSFPGLRSQPPSRQEQKLRKLLVDVFCATPATSSARASGVISSTGTTSGSVDASSASSAASATSSAGASGMISSAETASDSAVDRPSELSAAF